MTLKLRMATLLALCLAASVMTGCPVKKDEPNPDGINSCPAGCTCTDDGDTYEVICDGGGEGGEDMVYQ
ncbi:MAG: hypothetical protein ABW250_08555 [Pyrinomonadaceae bacterium]